MLDYNPFFRGATLFTALLIGPLLFLGACVKIHVDPRILPPEEGSVPLPASAPGARLVLEGPDVHRSDWAGALPASRLPISRIFKSRLTNRSGSLAGLLRPALREALRRKGYRLLDTKAREEAAYTLRVRLAPSILLWRPPQEFIKTPQGKRPGDVFLHFRFQTGLYKGQGKGGEPLWRKDFQEKRKEKVGSGDHVPLMGILGAQALRSYVDFLLKELPSPGRGKK